MYDEPVRQLVAAWKERGLRRLARWAAEIVAETIPRSDVSCLVAVPGDPDRLLRRGATVNAAASALRQAGARRVEVVTFARTIRRR